MFSAPVRREAVAKIVPPDSARMCKTASRTRAQSSGANENARLAPPSKTPIRGDCALAKRASAFSRRACKTAPEIGPTDPVMASAFLPPGPS